MLPSQQTGTAAGRAGCLRIGMDAHTLDGLRQGVRTVVENLAEQFARIGRPHEYVLYHKGARRWPASNGTVRHRAIPTNSGKLNQVVGFPLYAALDGVDLLHLHYVAPPFCPSPYVVTVHDILYERFPQFFGARHTSLLKVLVRLAARRARHVIAVSEFTRRELIERYGLRGEAVSAIPLGVSGRFQPPSAAVVGEALGRLNVRRPYLLYVGRIAPIKNLAGLLRAFAHLHGRGIDVGLVIVGGRDRLFRETASAAVLAGMGVAAERVQFTGEVAEEDLVALYGGAEALVFPSFGEGFGLPVAEAMACGAPVLCSRATSLPEVAGEAAWTFDPNDQEEFNARLEALLLDADARRALREAGLARRRAFTWERTAREMIAVYERAARCGERHAAGGAA